jgi:hypothetical protein
LPVVRDVNINLKLSNVLRRQGIRKPSSRPEMGAIVKELLTEVHKLRLLKPSFAYDIYSITSMDHDQLLLEGNIALHSRLLPAFISEAAQLGVVVCTIGSKLEEKVTEYASNKEALRSLLLDGIGSAAVDSLSQEVCRFMLREATSHGDQVSCPLNPGMPGFSLSEQWQIMKMVPAKDIGVSLTRSGIMVPRKSQSMVFGIGPNMPQWTQAERCAHCPLYETCPYRERIAR